MFNVALKRAIIESGRTQRAVAVAAGGIRENRLSDIIRLQARPSPSERAAIAAVLGRTESELFDGAEVSA